MEWARKREGERASTIIIRLEMLFVRKRKWAWAALLFLRKDQGPKSLSHDKWCWSGQILLIITVWIHRKTAIRSFGSHFGESRFVPDLFKFPNLNWWKFFLPCTSMNTEIILLLPSSWTGHSFHSSIGIKQKNLKQEQFRSKPVAGVCVQA